MIYVVLLIGAVVLAVLAFRRPIRKSPLFTGTECPVCRKKLTRVHRNWALKTVSVLIPLRAFECRSCDRFYVRAKPLGKEIGISE